MSLLCLDAGNTRLKWGLHDGARWLAQGAVAHAACEELPLSLPTRPHRLLACNVAGAEAATRIAALAATLDAPLDWFRSVAASCGVTNGYDDPTRLGADRWAALIGARALHAGGALVVMAGTATTIDALDAAGRFAGGLILPGIDLMRFALARNTADLPEATGRYRELPTNTDDAIASGILHATLGAIERMARRVAGADQPVGHRTPRSGGPEHGEGFGAAEHFRIILSGGAATVLAPHLELPHRRVDNLVLEGLARSAVGVW
jgi:type III pantothenate kinase